LPVVVRSYSMERKLFTVEEVWDAVGRDRLGRETLYRIMRVHGVRLGKRVLLPQKKLEALLEGSLDIGETPTGAGRG
jgi:hypothetical protein